MDGGQEDRGMKKEPVAFNVYVFGQRIGLRRQLSS